MNCDFAVPYVLLGQNWGKTCRPGERCPLILIHGIFIRSLVELCPNLEICGFSMLSYPKLKELWLSRALARPWFLQCSKLFFLSILGSRFQTPFDSWSVCEVVKEAILHMQQELRNEADRILKFGSCGGTWRRIEVFCYPTPQFYGISLCSKVYLLCSYIYTRKNHLLQVLLLIWTLFHSAYETAFTVFIPGTYLWMFQNISRNFTYKCWI